MQTFHRFWHQCKHFFFHLKSKLLIVLDFDLTQVQLSFSRRRDPDYGSYMHSLSVLDRHLNSTLNEVEGMSSAVDGLLASIRGNDLQDLFN